MNVRYFIKMVYVILFQTSIEKLSVIILVSSILYGLLLLTEPAISLRFRRSVRALKIIPWLCNTTIIQSLADSIFHLGNIPSVAVCVLVFRVASNLLIMPLMTFITAICNPVIARSTIILVGFPGIVLSMFCKLPATVSRRMFLGANVMCAWAITAVCLIMTQALCPELLHWAVADISISIYLAILAITLTCSFVQQRLLQQTRKQCTDLVTRCSLYLLAGVLAMWIILSSFTSLAAFNQILDIKRLSAGSGMHLHAYPHPHPA